MIINERSNDRVFAGPGGGATSCKAQSNDAARNSSQHIAHESKKVVNTINVDMFHL